MVQAAPVAISVSADAILHEMLGLGITHVVTVPDSTIGQWDGAIEKTRGVRMVRVCREGEAWAVAAGLQLVMIACWFAVVALGVLGLVFGLVWVVLLWMRHDVARRMAEGRLPSQQPTPSE